MTVFSRIAAAAVKLPPPQTTAVSVERGLTAKMPDGVELVADRWYPTHPAGRRRRPSSSARRTGARSWARSAGCTPSAATRSSIQSCRGTFGSGGEFVPVRNEQADGRATLDWVAAQPWFDGRLVMWGASYLGMTQWAVAQDAPGLPRGAQPPGHGGELPRLGRVPRAAPSRSRRDWPGCTRSRTRSSAGATVLRARLRGARVVATSSEVLPLGKCDSAAIGEPMAFYQDWLEHSDPGRPVVGRGRLRAPAGQRAAGQLHRRLVRPLPARRRWTTTRRSGGRAHGPPDHRSLDARQPRRCSPRPSATARAGSTASSGAGRDDRQDAPVRLFVMGSRTWQEFSHVAAGGGDRALVPRARRHADTALRRGDDSAPDRYHYNPHDPTPSVGGPSLNMTHGGAQGAVAAASAGATC